MTAKEKTRAFVARIKEESSEFDLLGSVCWWNLRCIDVTQEQFAKMLGDCGLPTKYAQAHNYRSAFIRALRVLEENRIIRKVSEDENWLVFQFTAESLVATSSDGIGKLDYKYETKVIIDKNEYMDSRDFSKAVCRELKDPKNGNVVYTANPAITEKVIALYEREKVRYDSADITRYIQRIFRDDGDIYTLRDQGNVYFIPAQFQSKVEAVSKLVSMLGNGNTFAWLPIADVSASRAPVSAAVIAELKAIIADLGKDIEQIQVFGSADQREKWTTSRTAKLERIRRQIERASNIVPETVTKELEQATISLEQAILKPRNLEIEE